MASRRKATLGSSFLLFTAFLALFATTGARITDVPNIKTGNSLDGTKSNKPDPTSKPSKTQNTQQTATATQASISGKLTDVPSIYGVGTPPLIVPDTSNAAFMQKSNLPEGTVFIAVGAALGFLGMSVLAWRGLVAWSLHRSVRRAAKAKFASEKKSMYSGSASTRYSNVFPSADMSLEHLAPNNTTYKGAGGQRGGSYNPPKRDSRGLGNTSLFFSPTAGGGQTGHNRTGSSYLPAGFYASGTSMPAAGTGTTQLGNQSSAGYGRVGSHPNTPPATAGHRRNESSFDATRNQARSGSSGDAPGDGQGRRERRRSGGARDGWRTSQARAPSAILDEMFSESRAGTRKRDQGP